MTRLLYDPWDRAARLLAVAAIAGCLVVTGYFVGHTTGVHRARAERAKDCEQRLEATAKARGYTIVRAAMPCEAAR